MKCKADLLKCAVIDITVDKDETFIITVNNNGKTEKFNMYSTDDYMFNKFKDMMNKNMKKDENISFIDKIL